MLADGVQGSIINMPSQMGHVGSQNGTVYSASKFAIEGLTQLPDYPPSVPSVPKPTMRAAGATAPLSSA